MFSCQDPTNPMDLDLLVWRDGQIRGFSTLFDGTAEAVEVDAHELGDYQLHLVRWDRYPKYGYRSTVGVSWVAIQR